MLVEDRGKRHWKATILQLLSATQLMCEVP